MYTVNAKVIILDNLGWQEHNAITEIYQIKGGKYKKIEFIYIDPQAKFAQKRYLDFNAALTKLGFTEDDYILALG